MPPSCAIVGDLIREHLSQVEEKKVKGQSVLYIKYWNIREENTLSLIDWLGSDREENRKTQGYQIICRDYNPQRKILSISLSLATLSLRIQSINRSAISHRRDFSQALTAELKLTTDGKTSGGKVD